ncbi:MAG: response regulator [Bacteroidales bacterium]
MNVQNNRKSILIIEDDHHLAKAISNLLTVQDVYEPHIAQNGSIGIQKAFEVVPDLILCDIGMSDIDGYQVFKILKESSITSMIPFIFLTGRSELNDIRLGLQLGADDYMVKPFQNDELLGSIRTRLEKYDRFLEMSRKNFQALVNISPNAIFILNQDGFIDVSPSFTKKLGYEKDQVLGKMFTGIVDGSERDKVTGELARIFKGIDDSVSFTANTLKQGGQTEEFSIFLQKGVSIKGRPNVIGVMVEKNQGRSADDRSELSEEEIRQELRRISTYLSENQNDVSAELVNQLKQVYRSYDQASHQNGEEPVELSKREKEVLLLACRGYPIKQIADELFISDRTVEKHRANLMAKTGSKNIVEVIIYAIKNSLIEI